MLTHPDSLTQTDLTAQAGGLPGGYLFDANCSHCDQVTWDFGDNQFGTGLQVAHTFATGTYWVSCIASGPCGQAMDSVQITVGVNDVSEMGVPISIHAIGENQWSLKGLNLPINELTAFDYSGKEAIMSGTDGKCKFKINESALGSHSHKGVIVYQDADGSDKAIPFIIPPFTVGEAALVVSPTAMMVFYERVENPVEISVPGVDASQLSVSMSGGSISPKGGGNYMVMPTNGSRDASINVTATINGKQVSMPAKQFKIKKLPDPTPSFQGKNHMTTTISRGDATAASAVFASMGADFVFQGIPVSINGFTMTVASAGKITPEMRATGGSLSSEMKTALSKVKTGDKIYVERIEASVAGERRPLPSISLKVQ
jgi:hypothetical protein